MIRVGFEVSSTCLKHPTGIARYSANLLNALQALPTEQIEAEFFIRHIKWKDKNYLPDLMRAKSHWYQKSFWPTSGKLDLIHGLDVRLPDWGRLPSVCTVHDLATFRLQDVEGVTSQRFLEKKMKEYKQISRQATHLISDSQSTTVDLQEYFQIPESKITTIHLAIEEGFAEVGLGNDDEILKQHGLLEHKKGYLLFIGNISIRKNLQRVVQAYAVSQDAKELPLVLVGAGERGAEVIYQTVKEHGLEKQVIFPNFIPDEHLATLYRNAKGFLFPTLYEGFGIPILEAMACGCPVMIGKDGSAPEIAKGAALVVDPYSVEEISHQMDALLKIDDAFIQRGKEVVDTYSWEKTAQATLEVYRKVLG